MRSLLLWQIESLLGLRLVSSIGCKINLIHLPKELYESQRENWLSGGENLHSLSHLRIRSARLRLLVQWSHSHPPHRKTVPRKYSLSRSFPKFLFSNLSPFANVCKSSVCVVSGVVVAVVVAVEMGGDEDKAAAEGLINDEEGSFFSINDSSEKDECANINHRKPASYQNTKEAVSHRHSDLESVVWAQG